APLVRDGETVGSVGVLGPTRMNYPAAFLLIESAQYRRNRRVADAERHQNGLPWRHPSR
ncbi:MAG: hypothetical protein EBZ88_08445, partial [Actinobacteria bacterium]|nr:hypothetical protein [Actinomycetota bacterium]